MYFIEAAHIDNKVGRTHNASIIADFCYTLLDYGKAVLEGARDGFVGVAQQAINDPLQTIASVTLSVAAGASLGEAIGQLRIPYPRRRSLDEYLLAYQLGKIAYGILNLTVNAVINQEQAQKTWDGYITPIGVLIDALKNKQISLRDGIRAGTALAVSMKAQSMLAKGCEKLYSVAKTRALTYLEKSPQASLDQYMTSFEGLISKFSQESIRRPPRREVPILGWELTDEYPKYADEAIEKGISLLMRNENNLSHVFGNERHKLDCLIEQLGGKQELLRTALQVLNGKVPFDRAFEDVVVYIREQPVYLRGKVVNEIPRISTMFIK